MASPVQGKDCIFQLNITGGYKVVVCSKSFSISVITEVIETTTITDGSDPEEGLWKDFDYQSLSYTILLEGIMKNTDASFDTIWEVFELQAQFLEGPWKAIYTDPQGTPKQLSGTCMVGSTNLFTPSGGLIDTSIEFIGKGKIIRA